MDLHFGKLTSLPGWDLTAEINLVEPAKTIDTPLSLKGSTPSPRGNIIVSRKSDTLEVPLRTWLTSFLERVAANLPTYEVVREVEEFAFSDGTKGLSVVIAFVAHEQLKVFQRHVVRADEGVITQLTATIDGPRHERLESDLEEILASFQPNSSSKT